MSNVKVVSSNTIIKRVVVGTPVPQVAQIRVVSDLGELQNHKSITILDQAPMMQISSSVIGLGLGNIDFIGN